MIGSNCSENNFDVRNLANTMLFMCADGYRHGQNYGVCRIEYAFGAGNKLRHSDLYSVRRDGTGTGYIELQLVQGDVQRQDGLCIFAVHAYQAYLVDAENRVSILNCLLEYDQYHNTPWERTSTSLLIEWEEHDRFAFAHESTQNVDFDNAEEGKGRAYFWEKALTRGFNVLLQKVFGGK